MKRLFGLMLALSAAAAFTLTVPALAHPTMDIVASNWKFTPDTITLHVGEAQEL